MPTMRRYSMISLALGAGATLVVLALVFAGAFDPVAEWLGGIYRSYGWGGSGEWVRYRWIELPLLTLVALAVSFGIVESTRVVQKVLVAGLSITVVALLSPALALYGILWEPVALLSATILAAGGAFLFSRTGMGRRKRLLEEALGTRVSATVFSNLLEDPVDPGFVGATREVTTVVCRWFPPDESSAAQNPAEALKMASLFLRSVSSFMLARGAYLNETGSERVLASFGMLRNDEDHAERACRAALDLRGRLRGLSREYESRWYVPLRWGIGIGTGTMMVGLVGGPERFSFNGLGGEMDFADRLALANRRLASDILLGPGSYRVVREKFALRPLEMLYDPAKRSVVEIYQLLSTLESLSEDEKAGKDWFWQGVIRLRERDFEGALDCFSRAKTVGVEDAPLDLLTGQAQEGIAVPESRPGRIIRNFADETQIRPISRL